MNQTYKLTLSIPEKVVRKAKAYAKRHATSVSSLVSAWFDALEPSSQPPSAEKREREMGVLTKSSLGVISLPNVKKEDLISEALIKRHTSL